jgi:hypothetical protein
MARTAKSLQREMAIEGPSKTLFDEVAAFAKKQDQNVIEFFEQLPAHVLKAWESDKDFEEWIESAMTPKAKRSGRDWFDKEMPRPIWKDQVIQVMSEHFITAPDAGNGWPVFEIKDRDRKIVTRVDTDAKDLTSVARVVAPTLEGEGLILDAGTAKTFFDTFKIYAKPSTRPVICAQPDDDDWCFHRIMIRPDHDASFPLIREHFLSRIDDPEAFCAWVYGVYSRKYTGRQVLWIKGNGVDGKSTWFDNFGRTVFGSAFGAIMPSDIENNPAFFMELIADKRFVWVPDNNNQKLLWSAAFKQVASGGADKVTVNGKFKKAYQTYLEANVAIGSNFAPDISGSRHNISRILWVDIGETNGAPDPTLPGRMMKELPGFLAYAEQCFAKRCPEGNVIEVNDVVKAKVEVRIADTQESEQALLDRYFVIEDGAAMSPADFIAKLEEAGVRRSFEQGNFRDWLTREYGIIKAGKPPTYRGIRAREPRDNRDAMNQKIRLVSNEVA